MGQREINEAEWRNPANWRGRFLRVYVSPRDTRWVVPKPNPAFGFTLNFAHPVSRWSVAATLVAPLILWAIAVLSGR